MTLTTDPDDALQIVGRLHQRTSERAVKWEHLVDIAEYKASSKNFNYFLKSRDEDDLPPYVFEIWRRNPQPSEENRFVKVEEFNSTATPGMHNALSALYRAAKFSALGIESLKQDILDDLE